MDWWVLLVAAFMLSLSIYRYIIFSVTNQEFVYDAQVWVSVGESVLQGQALYAVVADNKPPVWEGVVLFASATPVPYLVLLVIVGLSSGLLVVCVAQLLKGAVSEQAVVVATGLVGFGILTMTSGFINNKTLALAFLLVGILADREVMSGTGYALSLLVAQQMLFAVPVIVLWERARGSSIRKVGSVVLVLVIAAYSAVGLTWGVDAAVAALQQTLFLAGDYAAGLSQFQTSGSPLNDTATYIELLNRRLGKLTPIIALAGIGGARVMFRTKEVPQVVWLGIGLGVALTLPLGIRPYRHYWLLPIIGLSLLAAYGTDWLLNSE